MGRIQDNRVLRDRQILPASARQKLQSCGRHRVRWGQQGKSVPIWNVTGKKLRNAKTARRISANKSSDRSKIHSDISDFAGTAYRGVSLITGGFPCQPFSVAGKRGGAADDRAIWPQMFRVISEARPAWVLGENVPGIIPMELDNVCYLDLEGIGYATRTFVIPACAVDARHRRDRVWVVGRRIMGDPANIGSEVRHAQHPEPNRQEKNN